MDAMRRFALVLGMVCVAHAQDALPAQALPPELTAVAERLASTDAQVVLDAAERASDLADPRLGRALNKALATWRDTPEHGELRAWLLDALIRAKAKVPTSHLAPLLDDKLAGGAAFVLLAQEPAANAEELLAIFRKGWPSVAGHVVPQSFDPARASFLRTLAVANLLVEHKVVSIAKELLASTDPSRLVVTVGATRRLRNAIVLNMPAPRPPILNLPTYRLVLIHDAAAGTQPLARGPIGVGYVRDVVREIPDSVEYFLSDQRQVEPAHWLDALAGTNDPAPRVLELTADAKNFENDVWSAREALRSYRERLAKGLLERGAITANTAKTLLEQPIAVEVDDQRDDQSTPLPKVPVEAPR